MMTSHNELKLAKWITVILLGIGILSYGFAAYTTKTPDQPVRILYKTNGGKVLFDHKTHTAQTKYGLSCRDCHHHPENEEDAIQSCNFCHVSTDKDQSFNPNCLECHDQEEVEGVETNNQVDSTHSRGECIKCHKEYGKGPIKCEACHAN